MVFTKDFAKQSIALLARDFNRKRAPAFRATAATCRRTVVPPSLTTAVVTTARRLNAYARRHAAGLAPRLLPTFRAIAPSQANDGAPEWNRSADLGRPLATTGRSQS